MNILHIYIRSTNDLLNKQKETINNYNESLEIIRTTNANVSIEIRNTLNMIKKRLEEHLTIVNTSIDRTSVKLRINQKYYEESIIGLNEEVLTIHKNYQTDIINITTQYFDNLKENLKKEIQEIENIKTSIKDSILEYLNKLQLQFEQTNTNLTIYLTESKKINSSILINNEKTKELIENIKDGIENIKSSILEDLYKNHSLRGDLKDINESIKNNHIPKQQSVSKRVINWIKNLINTIRRR